MLPRHLQSFAGRSSSRSRALLQCTHRSLALPSRTVLPSSASARPFHSSTRRQNEVPKSPFQTFVEVLREELKKSREIQDNVKQLQGDVDKFQDSEAMKRARAAYEKARVSQHITPPVNDNKQLNTSLDSSRQVSRRTLDFVLQRKSLRRLELPLEMQCRKH